MKSGREIDVCNYKATYAALFFGASNRGIVNDYLRAMVKGQPNADLVEKLAPGSPYLISLHEIFYHSFIYSNSKIISSYETIQSPTPILASLVQLLHQYLLTLYLERRPLSSTGSKNLISRQEICHVESSIRT